MLIELRFNIFTDSFFAFKDRSNVSSDDAIYNVMGMTAPEMLPQAGSERKRQVRETASSVLLHDSVSVDSGIMMWLTVISLMVVCEDDRGIVPDMIIRRKP